tara:strand:+ start:280 stop:468 length:189 start_codon:yes stop_codon:yes gene_type:complete
MKHRYLIDYVLGKFWLHQYGSGKTWHISEECAWRYSDLKDYDVTKDAEGMIETVKEDMLDYV